MPLFFYSMAVAVLLNAPRQGAEDNFIYVKSSSLGSNNGTSWTDAFIDLQDALAVAESCSGQPCEIWVAAGTYTPDRGTGDPEATFSLVDGVGLYGGFAGWETERSQRDPLRNITVLSGDLLENDNNGFVPSSNCCVFHSGLGCDAAECEEIVCAYAGQCCNQPSHDWSVTCAELAQHFCCELCDSNRCDNTYHIATASGCGPATVLDGFTVMGGHARPQEYPESTGGGLLNLAASPTIANCTFLGNHAFDRGAAISNADGSSPLITDSSFLENRTNAIVHFSGSEARIERCSFVGNRGVLSVVTAEHAPIFISDSIFASNGPISLATFSVSAAVFSRDPITIIHCQFLNHVHCHAIRSTDSCLIIGSDFIGNSYRAIYNSGEVQVFDSRFVDNYAQYGGSAIANFDFVSLIDCEFSGNTSDYDGGVISTGLGSTTIAQNCLFRENTSTRPGGAIYNYFGVLSLSDCLFERNHTLGFGGGAIHSDYVANITRCVFRDNSANSVGGAISTDSFLGNELEVSDSVFAFNRAEFGGAIFIDDDVDAIINRCTFYGNESITGGGIYNQHDVTIRDSIFWANTNHSGALEPAQIFNDSMSSVQIDFSNVQGWTGMFGGTGNNGLDPLFVDPDGPDDIAGTADDNLRLSDISPLINLGDPDPDVTSHSDADGQARILCGRIDIGAYEFGIGDFNCDRVFELEDFAAWADCVTGPQSGPYDSGCEAYDFNAELEDRIDLLDFSRLQNSIPNTWP